MFGITGKHLQPINSLTRILDPDCDTEKLGAWGILYLCCGAMAGGNTEWHETVKNGDTFICSNHLARAIQGADVPTSEDFAIKFGDLIKEWCNSEHAIAVAEKRMEKYRGKISDTGFICNKIWLTLAYILNSLQDMSMEELLGLDCKTWVSVLGSKVQSYGWPELFFASGLILTADSSVSWDKMATAIYNMNKPHKEDLDQLFRHYAGKNQFSKPVNTRLRTDQLKKGMRLKLQNGWEAIVVEECCGNILRAKVFGDFTETGSVYAHEIVAAEVDGKWVEVKMTELQTQFQKEINFLRGQ